MLVFQVGNPPKIITPISRHTWLLSEAARMGEIDTMDKGPERARFWRPSGPGSAH